MEPGYYWARAARSGDWEIIEVHPRTNYDRQQWIDSMGWDGGTSLEFVGPLAPPATP
jgi:hypothetical protein